MGNGALPHGPSHRAHPRLYRLGSGGDRCEFPNLGVEQKWQTAVGAIYEFFDREAAVNPFRRRGRSGSVAGDSVLSTVGASPLRWGCRITESKSCGLPVFTASPIADHRLGGLKRPCELSVVEVGLARHGVARRRPPESMKMGRGRGSGFVRRASSYPRVAVRNGTQLAPNTLAPARTDQDDASSGGPKSRGYPSATVLEGQAGTRPNELATGSFIHSPIAPAA